MSNEPHLPGEWREWSAEKLEHEYSPSEWAKKRYSEYALLFQRRSDVAQLALGSRLAIDSYGPRPRNVVAWTPPISRDEMFVWIHGGYWQGSSINEALLEADTLASQGFGFAAIEYSLAPEVSIAEMISECETALAWIRLRNPGKPLFLGGHSAGAHLALAVAARSKVEGLVLVSGVFDLRPITATTINEPLGLDEAEAYELSPIFGDFTFPCAAEVLVGGEESPSFQMQGSAAFDYLTKNGAAVELHSLANLDHFDIILNGEHLKSFRRLADR